MRKMHWDCKNGENCFEKKKRVKLGVFDECFPGNIGMSDLDGIVEINGACLLLEWKEPGVDVPIGQAIMFKMLTSTVLFTVIVVEGNAEHMTVERHQLWFNKKPRKWVKGDMESLKRVICRWSKWAQQKKLR